MTSEKEKQTEKVSNGNFDKDINWNNLSGNELIGRLQMKTGRTRAQIRDWVKNSSKIM